MPFDSAPPGEATPPELSAQALPTSGRWRVLLEDCAALSKARLTLLAVAAVAVGFLLAPRDVFFPVSQFLAALVGTALLSASASALNQAVERRHDARMARTCERPIPSGRVSRTLAWGCGLLAGAIGLCVLCGGANSLAAMLGLASLLLYLFLYTPLKRVHSINTLIGAVPGALPPVIGWAAAAGSLDVGAWLLFAMLFTWQVPHFLAISWKYRHEYELAGFQMLPVHDASGRATSSYALLYALALLPLSLLMPTVGIGGWIYVLGATVAGALFALQVFRFWRRPDDESAHAVFRGSIIYLCALFALMAIDAGGGVPMQVAR